MKNPSSFYAYCFEIDAIDDNIDEVICEKKEAYLKEDALKRCLMELCTIEEEDPILRADVEELEKESPMVTKEVL